MLTAGEAIALLPEGECVHTFTPRMIGADHERSRLLAAIEEAEERYLATGMARATGHGLVIWSEGHGALFVEAVEERVSGVETARAGAGGA